MVYAFERQRLAQVAGCVALGAMAGVFLLVGALAPAEIMPFKWACWSAAGIFLLVLVPAARETFTPGPILTIGPEGITYQPFTLDPVPWGEVAAINRVRSPPRRDRDTANPARDGVAFVVRDLSRIALRRGFGGGAMTLARSMSGGGTQIMHVRANTEEILAAIKTYWRGDILIVTPTGRPYSSAAQENGRMGV